MAGNGTPTDEQWKAIVTNDASYDGQFFYGVKTTGIFCWPSCKSKPPNKENIEIFGTPENALAARYRPCKRCKPTGLRVPDEEWIATATEYIDQNYRLPLSLTDLAAACHGTPYHLHRTFKKITGITPVAYIQQVRIEHAKELLVSSDTTVGDAGRNVGFANTPYFITLFKRKTGFTPEGYRERHKLQQKEDLLHDKPIV